MAGLPKKYAKMGFKKGWRAYKQAKGLIKASTTKTKRTTTTKVKVRTMAKKKSAFKRAKNKPQKSGLEKGLMTAVNILLPVGYGYARERISDGVSNVLDKTGIGEKLPITEFTDEAVMLGASWGVGKLGVNKSSMGRKVLKTINIIEKGRIGETMADIQQRKKNTSSTNSGSW